MTDKWKIEYSEYTGDATMIINEADECIALGPFDNDRERSTRKAEKIVAEHNALFGEWAPSENNNEGS